MYWSPEGVPLSVLHNVAKSYGGKSDAKEVFHYINRHYHIRREGAGANSGHELWFFAEGVRAPFFDHICNSFIILKSHRTTTPPHAATPASSFDTICSAMSHTLLKKLKNEISSYAFRQNIYAQGSRFYNDIVASVCYFGTQKSLTDPKSKHLLREIWTVIKGISHHHPNHLFLADLPLTHDVHVLRQSHRLPLSSSHVLSAEDLDLREFLTVTGLIARSFSHSLAQSLQFATALIHGVKYKISSTGPVDVLPLVTNFTLSGPTEVSRQIFALLNPRNPQISTFMREGKIPIFSANVAFIGAYSSSSSWQSSQTLVQGPSNLAPRITEIVPLHDDDEKDDDKDDGNTPDLFPRFDPLPDDAPVVPQSCSVNIETISVAPSAGKQADYTAVPHKVVPTKPSKRMKESLSLWTRQLPLAQILAQVLLLLWRTPKRLLRDFLPRPWLQHSVRSQC